MFRTPSELVALKSQDTQIKWQSVRWSASSSAQHVKHALFCQSSKNWAAEVTARDVRTGGVQAMPKVLWTKPMTCHITLSEVAQQLSRVNEWI
eukprot:4043434-Amphidinium_carterae.1